MGEYLERCRRLECAPGRILVDSRVEGAYGGTGEVAEWRVVAGHPIHDWHPPLVLAGGLTPDNVDSAIHAVRPVAVDTASGVEVSPGRKSEALVERFVEAAAAAFRDVG